MLLTERIKIPGLLHPLGRSLKRAGSIFLPDADYIPRRDNVLALVKHHDPLTGAFIDAEMHGCHNIVTNAGDLFYAELLRIGYAVSGSPTNAFANCSLSSVDFSPGPSKTSTASDLASVISGGDDEAPTSTYPKENDGDADNTGAGVDILTWLYEWAKADFNDTDIEDGAIHVAAMTTWGSGAAPLLTAFSMTQFAKTANDTLKVFVNHEVLGV